MLINWFTVVAQIVNFLVLVALLKHFLWGPLLRAIDEREARISRELAGAEEKQRAVQEQMQQVEAVAREQERRCDEMLIEARKEADEQRLKMIGQSREAVRQLERQWDEDLEREKETFFKELRRRAATEILAVARQALADLASEDLQRSCTEVFLEKLKSFDAAAFKQMTNGSLTIRSAAELPKEIQQQVCSAIEQRTGSAARLQFVRDPVMSWGIELRGNGLKVGWSPESYLDFLEEKLRAELDRAPAAKHHVAVG